VKGAFCVGAQEHKRRLGLLVKFSLAIGGGVLHFNALAMADRCEYPDKRYSPETRMIVLPDAEDRTIVSLFVWTKHRNVTEGRTDRQTDRENRSGYYSGLHCVQCGLAVKSNGV